MPSQAQGMGRVIACSPTYADRSQGTAGRPHGSPASRGVQDRLLDSLRNVNNNKAGRRIEVILSAFVDDPHVPIAGGVLVREHLIDFMAL